MAEYASVAIDNYGKEETIKALQSREKILFLCSEADHINIAVDEWDKHLYPAKKLAGKNNTYYYAHVKDVSGACISSQGITSYEEFLQTK